MKLLRTRLADLQNVRVAGICVPVMALVGIVAVAAAVAMALSSGGDGTADIVEAATRSVQVALESRWQAAADWRQIGDIQAELTRVAASQPDFRRIRFLSTERDSEGRRFVFESSSASRPIAQPLQAPSPWVESRLREVAESSRVTVELSRSDKGGYGTGFAPIGGSGDSLLGFVEVQVELPASGAGAVKGFGLGTLAVLALGSGVWAWATKGKKRARPGAWAEGSEVGGEPDEDAALPTTGSRSEIDVRPVSARTGQVELDSIIDRISLGVVLFDGDRRVRLSNRLAREILGQPSAAGELKGRRPSEICGGYPGLADLVTSCSAPSQEHVLSGGDRSIAASVVPVLSDGLARDYLLTLKDVTAQEAREREHEDVLARLEAARKELEGQSEELAQANARLEQLSLTDPVTGLANHRRFMEAVAQEAERARATGRAFSVVLVDIDSFTDYNEEFGYVAGDEALRTAARVLRQSLRRSDLAARWGAGRLAAMLLDTDLSAALLLADRLTKHLEVVTFPRAALTFSIGVAEYARHGQAPRELLDAAEAALDAARQVEGNRVAAAPDNFHETRERPPRAA